MQAFFLNDKAGGKTQVFNVVFLMSAKLIIFFGPLFSSFLQLIKSPGNVSDEFWAFRTIICFLKMAKPSKPQKEEKRKTILLSQ